MPNPLLTLARYDRWANAQLLSSLTGPPATDDRVLHLLGHHVASKRAWLARIQRHDTHSHNLWPRHPVDEARPLLQRADEQLISLATADDPTRIIHYRNQTGAYFDTPLHDVITHIVNHATYHRGQLATAIQLAQGAPPNTDYITWHRAGSP